MNRVPMTPVEAMAAALREIAPERYADHWGEEWEDNVYIGPWAAEEAARLLSVLEASGYHLSMKEAAPSGAEAWREPGAFRVRVEGLADGVAALRDLASLLRREATDSEGRP